MAKGMAAFGLVLVCGLIARTLVSFAFIGSAVGVSLADASSGLGFPRSVSDTLSVVRGFTSSLGPRTRHETISVLDTVELEARQKDRRTRQTAGGGLILMVAPER
jgi:hypothetical protein